MDNNIAPSVSALTNEAGLPPLPQPVDCQMGPCHYFTGEQMRAYALAERERCNQIVMMAPFNQPHEDNEEGWDATVMALKAMAFDITTQIRGYQKPQKACEQTSLNFSEDI